MPALAAYLPPARLSAWAEHVSPRPPRRVIRPIMVVSDRLVAPSPGDKHAKVSTQAPQDPGPRAPRLRPAGLDRGDERRGGRALQDRV